MTEPTKKISWGKAYVKKAESTKLYNASNTFTTKEQDEAILDYIKSDEYKEFDREGVRSTNSKFVNSRRRQIRGCNDPLEEVLDPASEEEFDPASLPSRIVLSALGIMLIFQEIAGMSLPFGFSQWQAVPGHPDQGDSLKRGSQDFSEVDELLHKAVPVTWQGKAAQDYRRANSTLMDLAQKMVDQDLHMERIVKKHAECVTQTQLALGITQDILIAAYPVVCILEKSFTTYYEAYDVAYDASVSAIITGIGLLSACLKHADDTVGKTHNVDYADIMHEANKIGGIHSRAPSEFATSVSGGNNYAVVPGPAGASSTIPGTPTSTFSPDRFSGAGQAATAAEQRLAWASGPAAPITFGAPSASGQATNSTGSAAASQNGTVQPGQREQQAAPEEATSIDDVEDVGASSDVPWCGPAPIVVTAPKPGQASQASNLATSCPA